jgi:hypothetical protein
VSFASLTQADDSPYRLPPFAYYQPILDRMPFGAMPAVAPPVSPEQVAAAVTEAEVAAEQQALAKQVTMSAVNITPKGHTTIGFTDRSVNPPASYYLRVGESAGGWTVKDADFDDELATLEKDGVTITLKLGEGLVETPAAAPAAGAPPAAPAAGVPTAAVAAAPATAPTAAVPAAPALAVARRPLSRPPTHRGQHLSASAPEPSFADRLRERTVQKTQAQQEAEARMREQFERLARETAAREIQRRQEEEALAAEERALLEQQVQ